MGEAGAGYEARRLVRAALSATLATQAEGQPFASLVTPAAAPDLSPLMLLSSLSEHTRQLEREPRCALLFTGTAGEANPQTAPRVTLTGVAERVPAEEVPALKARWLARHPYAALYADFGDFALWRMRPVAGLLVGGFARATRLRQAELLPDPAAVAALLQAEAEILEHVNADHPDAVSAIAQGGLGEGPGAWRMVAVDTDGFDIAEDERVRRVHWEAPVHNAQDVRAGLIRLARLSRQKMTGD